MRLKWHLVLIVVTILAAIAISISLGNEENAPGQENKESSVEEVSSLDVTAAGGPIRCTQKCTNLQTCIDGACIDKTKICNKVVMDEGEVCCGKGKNAAPCDADSCIGGKCCDNPCFGVCCGVNDVCLDDGCCTPSPEACDGVDNDCDSAIDEEDGGSLCACDEGTAVCLGEGGCCCSTPEVCDGVDNDCDGAIDEGDACSCTDPNKPEVCTWTFNGVPSTTCCAEGENCAQAWGVDEAACCPSERYIPEYGTYCCPEGMYPYSYPEGGFTCEWDSCINDQLDPGESDINCGGNPGGTASYTGCYKRCENGESCAETGDNDCASYYCNDGTCAACTDSSQCEDGYTCEGGVCESSSSCGDFEQYCNGECIQMNDPNNCFACDNVCAEGQICDTENGNPGDPNSCVDCTTLGEVACTVTGQTGNVYQTCVDTSSDPEHCGDCDTACVCADGIPVCLGTDGCCCNTGPEVCDEVDNNCDGNIDEGDVCAGKKGNGEACWEPTECISGYCEPGIPWSCQPVPSGGLIDGTECDPNNDKCTNGCTSTDGTFYSCGGCLGLSYVCSPSGGEEGSCCSGYYCTTDHGAAMCDCRYYGESCDETMPCCSGLQCISGKCVY